MSRVILTGYSTEQAEPAAEEVETTSGEEILSVEG